MGRQFKAYIGIDYSGASKPVKRLPGLQLFKASQNLEPQLIRTSAGQGWNWSRKEIAYWCLETLKNETPIIIGIDHVFSFPSTYMHRYQISSWNHFLDDFHRHWPTDQDHVTVESCREGNKRSGSPHEFRLTEDWTSGAKSFFRFNLQGTVAYSSHAGTPWLRFLRRHTDLKAKIHFWPFDGLEIPSGKSVIAEVYSALFKRRFRSGFEKDAHDAYSIAKWLQAMDIRGVLDVYFKPPLTTGEKKKANLEGWILGVY